MKRALLTASGVVPLLIVAMHSCAVDDTVPPNNNTSGSNTTNTTGSNTGGAGGGSTTGNPTTTQGTGGNAGSTTTVTTTGGSAGNGMGGAGVGGAGVGGAGVGGSTGGGGAGVGGSTGGGGAGVGGSTGGGGAGVGGSTGGSGGTGIDGLAGTGMPMKSNYGFYWKDSWVLSPCYTRQDADCFTAPGTGCPNTTAADFEDRGSNTKETFPLGGVAGTHYLVTFKYNSVAEAKFHSGGSFADPTMVPATIVAGNPGTFNDTRTHENTFYIGCGVGAMPCTGAAATAQNATTSTYNVYRLRVTDDKGTLVGRYYMNAFPANGGWESHRTFRISYTHQIEVVGGGKIEFQSADSNCRAIANCGDGTDVTNGACNAPRQVSDIGGDMGKVPPTYANIPIATLNTITGANDPQHWFAQFGHFVITDVTAK